MSGLPVPDKIFMGFYYLWIALFGLVSWAVIELLIWLWGLFEITITF